MNMLKKHAVHFAALALVLSAAGCSMDVAGVTDRAAVCTWTLREDVNGTREGVCAEELIDNEVLEDGKAKD